MTIYEIKRRTFSTAPYFFNRDTLRFFAQTMKSFKVTKVSDTKYLIRAPRRFGGFTERIFDSNTNRLEGYSSGTMI